MKIAMIHLTRHPFPPDVRIEKELRALCAAGHEVTVVARRLDPSQPASEILADTGAKVVRLSVDAPWAGRRLLSRATLRMPEWYGPLEAAAARLSPDVLHVHDLPALPTVLHVARAVPVVADLHENMPAALSAYRSGYGWLSRLRHAVLFNERLWRWHEARALRACARVIVVVPEAATRLHGYGVPDDRVVIVSNTEDPTTFCTDPGDGLDRARGDGWVAGYVGGMGPHRGIDTVLRAMPHVLREAPDVRFRVVGADGAGRRDVLAEAGRLGIADSVHVEGWRPFAEMPEIIRSFDGCLVPHNDFEHTQTTVPHKLFQYMLCGRPVVVSDVAPLARIVRETRAGLVFVANDPRSCAARMLELRRDPARARALGLRGRAAASTTYAWQHDAGRLVDMYADLGDDATSVARSGPRDPGKGGAGTTGGAA